MHASEKVRRTVMRYQIKSCSLDRVPSWYANSSTCFYHRSIASVCIFCLQYTAELEQLILCNGLHIHQYADHMQPSLYQRFSDARVAVHSFDVCVHDVNEWMRASRLRLNPTSTQVMWLGSGQQLKQVYVNDILVLSTTVPVVESVRDRSYPRQPAHNTGTH